ncbi:thiol reductant ABC exporter subunit CydD [Ferirhizobium litorale]|uniref:Thiol reductant ABC exporter subunit CydD n=1 Tax=Ferirhizobium litorale TaxID=2927786 RepID=A0AAE3QEF4_9HYPH|nr:thiol reductant ABC exporter subunit CydD [Fererhizobium litorale]MDI7922500.1 thiol reductant ABC exporter subunit CydD [Fererhizobium litorale]
MDASSLSAVEMPPLERRDPDLEGSTAVTRRKDQVEQISSTSTREKTPTALTAHRGSSTLAALLQTLAALLWAPQACAIAYAVGGIAAGEDFGAVLAPALVIVAAGIARTALDATGGRLAFSNARRRLSDARRTAIAALAARSPIDIDRAPSGLAASVLAEQAEALVPYLARFHIARLKATVVPIAFFLCILPFSWIAALVLLLAAPLIPVFMALIGMKAQAASERQLAETGGMNAFLLDRLRGLATIRALGAVDLTSGRLRADAESLHERTMAVLRIAFLSSAVLELFAALGVAMTAVYIGFHLLGELNFGAWGSKLTLSEGLFILLLAPAFLEPLRELSAVWHDRAAGEAAFRGLHSLNEGGIDLPGATTPLVPGQRQVDRRAPHVSLEQVSFRYPGSSVPVPDDFNLDIAPGEHVAILGPSGTGKSTLLALIAGLALPEAGRVRIGETTLDNMTAPILRRHMAWIGQRPHIFSGTFATNITLGDKTIDQDRISLALRAMSLDALAETDRNRTIGEGGAGLSGGEALRLVLARAAARTKATLILADEPTAHLDTQTATEITDGLLAIATGKTLIVATHDPVLAARMDRIVNLQPGSGEVQQ